MLKRLKKEIVILLNIFLGLHLCTSEFSQSTFGCSRVCERRFAGYDPGFVRVLKVVPRNLKILVVWQRPSMVLVLLRSRFATEICIIANGIGFGPA